MHDKGSWHQGFYQCPRFLLSYLQNVTNFVCREPGVPYWVGLVCYADGDNTKCQQHWLDDVRRDLQYEGREILCGFMKTDGESFHIEIANCDQAFNFICLRGKA